MSSPNAPRSRAAVAVLLAALLVAVAASLAVSAPAYAHAGLVSTSPADGARLPVLPERVTLTFTEEIAEPAYVVVTAADGTTVARGEPTVDGTVVDQALAGGPAGDYTMAYRVVSSDGHPVTGQVTFTVASDAGPAEDATTTAAPTPSEAAGPAPETTPVRAVADGTSFWDRYAGPSLLVAALVVAAGGWLVLSRRRRA